MLTPVLTHILAGIQNWEPFPEAFLFPFSRAVLCINNYGRSGLKELVNSQITPCSTCCRMDGG